MNDLCITFQIEYLGCYKPTPLKMNLALEIRVGQKIGVGDLCEDHLSFPGGFVLGMVAPLNFAKLDNLAAGDSAGIFENLHWFLFIGQITIQLNCFQRHCISQRYISHLCVAHNPLCNSNL